MLRQGVRSGVGLAILLGLIAACAVAVPSRADDKAKEDKGEKERTIVKTKHQKITPFKADFHEVFNLGLPAVNSLPGRIIGARRNPNPIALALLSKEVQALEEVVGKKASITSTALADEAVKMAANRNIPAELRVVAKLLGKHKEEEKLLAQADKTEDAQKANAKSPKGITEYLIVRNNTKYYARIYVNDVDRGIVGPYSSLRVYVGDSPFATTKLYADAGVGHWGPRNVSNAVANVTWDLDAN